MPTDWTTSRAGSDPADDSVRRVKDPLIVALDLIDAVYGVLEDPSRAPELLERFQHLAVDQTSADAMPRVVAAHLDRASALARRLNVGKIAQSRVPRWDSVLLARDGRVIAATGDAPARLEPFLAEPVATGQALPLIGPNARSFNNSFVAVTTGQLKLSAFTLSAEASGHSCLGFCATPETLPLALRERLEPILWPNAIALVLASRETGMIPPDLLRLSLKLSPAEWRLIRRLQDGVTLAEAAKEMSISANTVRSCLKSVFRKMGIHRQRELFQILSALSHFRLVDDSETAGGPPARRSIRLADGRTLAFRDYGPKTGLPVVCFHTSLGASLMHQELLVPARKRNIRFIAVDRPGFGHSTPSKIHTFESVAADVSRLVDHLRLRRFAIYGSGIGAAFALATARKLPHKTTHVALHAPRLRMTGNGQGGGSFHRAFHALLQTRWAVRAMGELMHHVVNPSVARAFLMRMGAEMHVDAKVLSNSVVADGFVAQGLDAFEVTSRGLADEMSLLAAGAFADPRHVRCPIGIWQGANNTAVPAADTVAMFAGHPTAQLHVVPEMGIHLSDDVIGTMMDWLGAAHGPIRLPGTATERG